MGQAYRPKLYVNGVLIKRATNVTITPEGGETVGEFGMQEDPVGVSTSPYGLGELGFDHVPMEVNGQMDAETSLFDRLEFTREPFTAVKVTGPRKKRMVECVMQPTSENVEEGASKDTLSRRAKGRIVRAPS
jgi:hypothetical protein